MDIYVCRTLFQLSKFTLIHTKAYLFFSIIPTGGCPTVPSLWNFNEMGLCLQSFVYPTDIHISGELNPTHSHETFKTHTHIIRIRYIIIIISKKFLSSLLWLLFCVLHKLMKNESFGWNEKEINFKTLIMSGSWCGMACVRVSMSGQSTTQTNKHATKSSTLNRNQLLVTILLKCEERERKHYLKEIGNKCWNFLFYL